MGVFRRISGREGGGSVGRSLVGPGDRQLGSVPGLDGIRGAAVALVVVAHLSILRPFEPRSLVGGFLGVDLFFALSGFLITAILLREDASTGQIRLGAFYARRALRLLPALLAVIFAHAVYAHVQQLDAASERNTAVLSLLYLTNWAPSLERPISLSMSHLWSLSVEEQFYIAWPLALIALIGVGARRGAVVSLLIGVILAVAIHRAQTFGDDGDWGWIYIRTDFRADGLLVGCLAALLWTWGWLPRRGLSLAAWLAAAFIGWSAFHLDVNDQRLFDGGFTAVAVAGAVVIVAVVEGRWLGNRVLGLRPVRAVGRVSYGIYLWHFPIFWAVLDHTSTWSSRTRVLFAVTLLAVVTLLSRYLVELPFLRLKDRFEPEPFRPTRIEPRVLNPAAPGR